MPHQIQVLLLSFWFSKITPEKATHIYLQKRHKKLQEYCKNCHMVVWAGQRVGVGSVAGRARPKTYAPPMCDRNLDEDICKYWLILNVLRARMERRGMDMNGLRFLLCTVHLYSVHDYCISIILVFLCLGYFLKMWKEITVLLDYKLFAAVLTVELRINACSDSPKHGLFLTCTEEIFSFF